MEREPGSARLTVDPSFDAFAERAATRLLRTAYLLCGDRDEAEDALQVALVRTARRWDVARAAPNAYIYRVLVNLMRDRHRRSLRRVPERPLAAGEVAAGWIGDHADAVVDRDAIVRAVKLLAPRQREVVVLRYFADLSVAETAAAIGASPGTIKTHTSRALARLRGMLADEPTRFIDAPTEVPNAD